MFTNQHLKAESKYSLHTIVLVAIMLPLVVCVSSALTENLTERYEYEFPSEKVPNTVQRTHTKLHPPPHKSHTSNRNNDPGATQLPKIVTSRIVSSL